MKIQKTENDQGPIKRRKIMKKTYQRKLPESDKKSTQNFFSRLALTRSPPPASLFLTFPNTPTTLRTSHRSTIQRPSKPRNRSQNHTDRRNYPKATKSRPKKIFAARANALAAASQSLPHISYLTHYTPDITPNKFQTAIKPW